MTFATQETPVHPPQIISLRNKRTPALLCHRAFSPPNPGSGATSRKKAWTRQNLSPKPPPPPLTSHSVLNSGSLLFSCVYLNLQACFHKSINPSFPIFISLSIPECPRHGRFFFITSAHRVQLQSGLHSKAVKSRSISASDVTSVISNYFFFAFNTVVWLTALPPLMTARSISCAEMSAIDISRLGARRGSSCSWPFYILLISSLLAASVPSAAEQGSQNCPFCYNVL